MLAGILFLNPLVGMAIGAVAEAGAGALSGSLSDYSLPHIAKAKGLSRPGSSIDAEVRPTTSKTDWTSPA
jgi:uncharacterized membrane protein